MRNLLLAACLAILPLLGGCGPALEESPDYEVVGGKEDDVTSEGDGNDEGVKGTDEDRPAAATPPAAPAAPTTGTPAPTGGPPVATQPVVYTGKLTTTASRAYGGDGFCDYTMTMKNVSVVLEVADGKMLVDAVVKSTMNEQIVGDCDYASIRPNLHHFGLVAGVDVGAMADGATKTIPMKGINAMAPKTTLTLRITKRATSYEANLSWKRNDNQQSALMWTTTAKVTTTAP